MLPRGTVQIGLQAYIFYLWQAEFDTAQLLKPLDQRRFLPNTFNKIPDFRIFPD